ncbi:YfgM family protein [Alteromonas gilva]|uniref:Ancillary SecYEG translocon subunit n=1 Tax=Alteromonas gilva TaxID=2987522 RepID=A0ABT5L9E0_9ALTE|nr:tetratricopeptide repeat protein [Alteromonas gilva]MDC8832702.1 tetratricopeptide repeat protein [Alteromonas gilva]
MEQFATEDQQVEAIKRFWSEHGTSLIMGAVLGLAGLFGWQYYTDSQISAKETASQSYQSALEALINEENREPIEAVMNSDEVDGYANIAALLAAKQAVDDGELDAAANYLQKVVSQNTDDSLKHVATVRLARVQLAQQKQEQALATIESVTDEAFSAQVEEIKGDIFSAQGNFDKARMAYSTALEKNMNNRLLQLKLDNLAVSAG